MVRNPTSGTRRVYEGIRSTIRKCVNEKGGVAFRLKARSFVSTTHPVAAGMKGDATHEREEHNYAIRVNGLLRDDGSACPGAHSRMAAGFARNRGDGVSGSGEVAAASRRRRCGLPQRLRQAQEDGAHRGHDLGAPAADEESG